MKNINTVLKHVITPFLLCFFFVLGTVAAALSGIVEYSVIKELFTGNNASGYNRYTPLIVIFVLEGLKLFLHYVIPSHKRIGDNGTHLTLKKIVKYVLVLFSLICTVVYVSNSLYNPNMVETTLNTQKSTVIAKYEEKLKSDISVINNEAEKQISDEKEKITRIEKQLESLVPIYEPYEAYRNYLKEKKRLENELNNAEKIYEQARDEIVLKRDNEIESIKISNSNEMGSEIEKLNQNEQILTSGDNTFLSSALLFFYSIFGQKTYHRAIYYLCVLCIATIISVMLEITITYSFSYIALDSVKLKSLFGSDEPIDEKAKRYMNYLLKMSVQASIMLAIYLVYQAICEETLTVKNMAFAFSSYFASIILTSDKIRIKLNTNNSTNGGTQFSNRIKKYILPVMVQTLLCIVGFLTISVYYGYSLPELIPTTVALSVGSVSGQVLFSTKT